MAEKKSSFGKIILIISGIALAIIGINWYVNRNKKQEGIEDVTFHLPTAVNPDVFGPSYWRAFHELASKVPCGACRGFAEKFMIFFHDIVNIKTGKALYDPENFNMFTQLIAYIKANGNKFPTSAIPAGETSH